MVVQLGCRIIQFLASLSVALRTIMFSDFSPENRTVNTPQRQVQREYDFIIVGAGTAGCTLANRLTEVGNWNVLLIEAGEDENALSDTPSLSLILYGSRFAWKYFTVDQENLCREFGGACIYSRGKAMGGSSTINAMMYVRGDPKDFDEWAKLGNHGWSYDDLLKYFIKFENVTLRQNLLRGSKDDSRRRGYNGPVTVQYSKYITGMGESIIKAANQFGYKWGDYNGATTDGIVGYVQSTVNDGSRESASRAYLYPIGDRKNLDIIKSALVTKLIFDDSDEVTGVEYVRAGTTHQVRASKEVILSAGAINSPKILLLSGIGPEDELNSLNIPVRKNLPVGKNLQDHPLVALHFITNRVAELNTKIFFSSDAFQDYTKNRQGPLAATFTEIVAFNSYLNETHPNGQWMTIVVPLSIGDTDALVFLSSVVRPYSRGTVKLKSANPYDDPLIDPNFLAEERDKNILREILREKLRLVQTPVLKKLGVQIDSILNALCSSLLSRDEDKFIDCLIENQSYAYLHPVGTARMGPPTDEMAVVDSDLRVYGYPNLRVIDASIMPNITSGNTNAPTYAIAEKGADLIKQTHI